MITDKPDQQVNSVYICEMALRGVGAREFRLGWKKFMLPDGEGFRER